MRRFICLVAFVSTAAGCSGAAQSAGGVFLAEDPVFIAYGDSDDAHLVSDEWIEGKDTDDYDDATYGSEGEDAPEIILRHRRTNGAMFVRAVLPDDDHEAKDLRVLGQNVIDNVAAFGFYRATVGPDYTTVESRRYAAELLDRRDLTISGQEAHAVLMDIANVDQVQIDESARVGRAVILIIRLADTREVREGRGFVDVPVMLIAGYINSPDDFDAHLGEFEHLLERMQIGSDRIPARN